MGADPGDSLQRLDPDRAAGREGARPGAPEQEPPHLEPRHDEPRHDEPPHHEPPGDRPPPPRRSAVYDTSRYQWLVALVALALVIAFSVSQLTAHHRATAGVPAGTTFKPFAAPLATSSLIGDANLRPPCSAARHDPRALNICLMLQRGPVVLAFFVTQSGSCERAVDAMQTIAPAFRGQGVQFAAVAVRTGHAAAAKAVRKRGWTLPIAYDRDGAVGGRYGVEVCPLLQLVRRGGVVAERLIGKRWTEPAALAARVRALVRG